MYKKISKVANKGVCLAALGIMALYTACSGSGDKRIDEVYNHAMEAPISELVENSNESRIEMFADGKAETYEIRDVARDYLSLKRRLAKGSMSGKEKSDLEAQITEDKKLLDQYFDEKKEKMSVSFVMGYNNGLGGNVTAGSDYELNLNKVKSVEDVIEALSGEDNKDLKYDLLARIAEKYAPLNNDEAVSYEDYTEKYVDIRLNKTNKTLVKALIKDGLCGKIKYDNEELEKLTDDLLENGELNGFGVRIYCTEPMNAPYNLKESDKADNGAKAADNADSSVADNGAKAADNADSAQSQPQSRAQTDPQ